MVSSIEGNLPVDPDTEADVPLVYVNPSTGERTKIGTAHVKGGHFTAELEENYKFFFRPQDLHMSFSAEIKDVKCAPIPAFPRVLRSEDQSA